MQLAVDLGNTNIVFGFFSEETLQHSFRIATDKKRNEDEYIATIINMMVNLKIEVKVEHCLISSVVPSLTLIIKETIEKLFVCTTMVMLPGIRTGLKINIDNANELGSDLIAGCVGAINQYKSPLILIDFGTATKINVIDKNGAFIGCQIIPGVKLAMEALKQAASQLPDIAYRAPKKVIGRNTVDSLNSGVIIGTATMIDGLVERIEKELGYPCNLIATGGLHEYIIPNCHKNYYLNKDIVLYGICLILNKNL